jgi:CBS domain-containing protein
MMCLWSFSLPTLLKDVEENKGINLKDIEKITLNGYYSLHLKDRIETMPIDDARKHIMQGCSTCSDYSSLLADISVGNAYPLEEWSLVIVRTKIGEEFFKRALNERCIEAKELENETAVFSHITTMDNLKKKIALGEIERIKSNDRPTPPNLGLLRPDDIESPSKEINMLDKLTVTEIMTSGVMTISPETTATELFGIMTKHHHMGYPIVDDDGNLTGIATFEDIMKIPLEERSKVKVGSIVHERLFTVAPTDTALAAYRMMMAHGIGRILVVDQLNPHKLLGIITRTDILHVFTWFPRQK